MPDLLDQPAASTPPAIVTTDHVQRVLGGGGWDAAFAELVYGPFEAAYIFGWHGPRTSCLLAMLANLHGLRAAGQAVSPLFTSLPANLRATPVRRGAAMASPQTDEPARDGLLPPQTAASPPTARTPRLWRGLLGALRRSVATLPQPRHRASPRDARRAAADRPCLDPDRLRAVFLAHVRADLQERRSGRPSRRPVGPGRAGGGDRP